MLARPLSAWFARLGIHYAWVIVAVAFLVSLSTAGAVGLPGVFIIPLSKEFGWDTAQISGALGLRLLLFGLIAPFAAALIERYGMRRMIAVAVTLVVSGMLLALAMTALWQLVVLWGLVVGVGTGLTALVLGATVSTRWFTARRGLVLGLLTAANATGQLIFLPLGAYLIEHTGWRAALALPVACLIVAGVLVLLFLRERPADLGLAPYGETNVVPAPAVTGSVGAAMARAFTVLREASSSATFWILFSSFFICGLSTNGLIQTHFVPLCVDFGMPSIEAASTLAMMGVFDFVGTIASGWLSDRYDSRKLLFWYYALRGLSLIWLPFSTFTFYGLSLFAIFYGLDWIATVPPTVKLSAQYFGRERATIIFGWVFTAHQIGAAVAAFGAGLTRTMLYTYLPAFYAAGIVCLLAAGLVLLIGRGRISQAAPALQ
jgi:sugar phosphate permease